MTKPTAWPDARDAPRGMPESLPPAMNSQRVPSEDSQLAILASEASTHDKAIACQKLVYVAGPKSVAPLAALLGDDELAAYARSGLEAINAPTASRALIEALPLLEGDRLAGVVISLGVRRERTAVGALAELVDDPAKNVRTEAIAALGGIATPEALEVLEAQLSSEAEELRTAAGHALLAAADRLEAATAASLRAKLAAAFSSGPIHDAAVLHDDP